MKKWFKHKEELEEKNSDYLCRCHQCGEEFMAVGMLMDSFASSSFLLIKPKECPSCGSIKVMPVMFEDDGVQVERYQRMWELMERKALDKKKNSCNHRR